MPNHMTPGDAADATRGSEPDAHGQAALLLAESTLHALVAAGALSHAQAITAVQVAAEVKEEIAELTGESKRRMEHSIRLLGRIERSLAADGDGAG